MNIHPLIKQYWENKGYTLHNWSSISQNIVDAYMNQSWNFAIASQFLHQPIVYRPLIISYHTQIDLYEHPCYEKEILQQLKLLPFL